MPRAVIPPRFDSMRQRQQLAAAQRDVLGAVDAVAADVASLDGVVGGVSGDPLADKFATISARLDALDSGGPIP